MHINVCIYGAAVRCRQIPAQGGWYPLLSSHWIRYTAKQHYPHGIASGCYEAI